MRITCLISILVLLPLVAFSQDPLTLDEAISISLERNFELKQAENQLGFSETQIRSARMDYLPSLNASFGGNQNVGRQFVEEDASFEERTTYNLSGGIQASVTIFNGFENLNNLRRSRANYDQQRADTERIRETIVFQTAMQYLQVLLDRELLDIAEQNLETSQAQLRQVEAQVEVGSRPVVDLYQQESTVAQNELQVVQAENSLSVSRTGLVRMLQLDPLEEFELETPEFDTADLSPQHLDLEELIEAALANRKDVQAQRLALQVSRYDMDIARGARYPSVTAGANMNTRYSDQYTFMGDNVAFSDQFFDQMISRSINFSVSIPIFNNWSTNTSIQQAQVQYRNQQLNFEDIRYEIREEISQVYNDYQSLSKEMDATASVVRAAERAFETQQQRYEIGSASLIELTEATRDYVQAQSERQQVLYNFVFQEKLLDYYLGQLGDHISF